MKVTLDTSVLVRCHYRASGPARELFQHLASPSVKLVLSQYIIDEVARVLKYPRLRELFGLKDSEIDEYAKELFALAEIVQPASPKRQILPDPNDDDVLLTAWAGQVDFLCANDQHFYHPAAKVFCARYGIVQVRDLEFLALLRNQRI